VKSTGQLTEIRQPAPWLGQHTEEVLREIGYGEGDVRQLFADGVVYDSDRGPVPAPAR
jgi:crotonobetainyl-CoA:carnitine CoA-transferase CaiB-like acyl-CoA transferase